MLHTGRLQRPNSNPPPPTPQHAYVTACYVPEFIRIYIFIIWQNVWHCPPPYTRRICGTGIFFHIEILAAIILEIKKEWNKKLMTVQSPHCPCRNQPSWPHGMEQVYQTKFSKQMDDAWEEWGADQPQRLPILLSPLPFKSSSVFLSFFLSLSSFFLLLLSPQLYFNSSEDCSPHSQPATKDQSNNNKH